MPVQKKLPDLIITKEATDTKNPRHTVNSNSSAASVAKRIIDLEETGKKAAKKIGFITFLRRKAGKLLLSMAWPAAANPGDYNIKETHKNELNYQDNLIQEKKVERDNRTYQVNGVSLDAAVYTTAEKNPDAVELHTYYFMGNCSVREIIADEVIADLKNFKENYASKFNLVAHTINPHGMGESTGSVFDIDADRLVDDYVKIIKHDIDELVKNSMANGVSEAESSEENRLQKVEQIARQINLKCHSWGAGYGTLIAARLHKEGYPVNLDHGSSFASPAQVITGKNKITTFFLKLLTRFAGWEIDAKKAYQKLPFSSTTHLIRKQGKNEPLSANGNVINLANSDGVIPYEGSLHFHLKDEFKEGKKFLKEFEKCIEAIDVAELPIFYRKTTVSFNDLIEPKNEIAVNNKATDKNYKDKVKALCLTRKKFMSHYQVFSDWYELRIGKELNFEGLAITSENIEHLKEQIAELRDAEFKANKFYSKNASEAHDLPFAELTSRSKNNYKGKNANEWYGSTVVNRIKFFKNHFEKSVVAKSKQDQSADNDIRLVK